MLRVRAVVAPLAPLRVTAAIVGAGAAGTGAARGVASDGVLSLSIMWTVDGGAAGAGAAHAIATVSVSVTGGAPGSLRVYVVRAPAATVAVDAAVALGAPAVRANVTVSLANCYGASPAAHTWAELLVLRTTESAGDALEARTNCSAAEWTTSVRRMPSLAGAGALPLLGSGSVCAAHGVPYAPAPDVYGVDWFVHVVAAPGGAPRDVGVLVLVQYVNQVPRLAGGGALSAPVGDGDGVTLVDLGAVSSDVEGDALAVRDVRWLPVGAPARASQWSVVGLVLSVRVGGWDAPATGAGGPAAVVRGFRVLAFRVVEVGTGAGVSGNVSFDVTCGTGAAGVGSVPNVWSRGALCVPCPAGAKCADDGAPPYALPGFFGHADGDGGLVFAECAPAEKCCGANTCCDALGYTDPSRLCAVCAPRHYKLGTSCRPCPATSGAASLLVFAAVGVIACVAICWVMARGVDTAFVQIGINFSQTIAIISSFRVAWPGAVAGAMSALSFANLNLDLAKPECSIPDFGWTSRWGLYMLAPPVVVAATLAAVFVVGPCVGSLRRACGRPPPAPAARPGALAVAAAAAAPRAAARRASAAATMKEIVQGALKRSQLDLAKLISLMAIKILYVMLCTQALSFFDCTRLGEVNPVYVFDADPSEKCDGPFALRTSRTPLALLATAAYVVGIPVLLSVELRASPVRHALRVIARATHGALTSLERHPPCMRPAICAAATLAAAALTAVMLVYAAVLQCVLTCAGLLDGTARAVIACASAGPVAAAEECRARVAGFGAAARAAFASRVAFAEALRRACCVPRGPFAGPDAPGAAEPAPTSFVALALGRDFRPERWYWELWILCRKLLMLLPQLFASSHVEFEAICVVIVIIIALCVQAVAAPYKSLALNSLEFSSLACSCLVILCALLFKAGSFPSSPAVNAGDVVSSVCAALILGFITIFGAMTAATFCASRACAPMGRMPPRVCVVSKHTLP